jgi:hypothetical protein
MIIAMFSVSRRSLLVDAASKEVMDSNKWLSKVS